MALRLRATGAYATRLGDRGTRVFGVHGGRIGRASDNDWVLPDPERFLSGHHAVIEYRGGQWYVVDTSSNGTYLNDATVPLGRDTAHLLKNGDHLRVGEYDLIVSLSPDNDFPPDVDAVAALDPEAEADLALATHGDLGAELDLKRLISDPNPPPDDFPPPEPIRVSDAYGQSVSIPSAPRMQAPALNPPASGTPVTGMAPSVPAAPAARASVRSIGAGRGDAPTGHGPLVQAFCRGAGLDPASLSVEQATAALALAGQLVREMALGLITSQQHRAEQTGRFQIEDTSLTPVEHNPFRMATSVDEVIARLFGPRSTRFLTPLEAVRASFNELRRHEQATQVAMQDAIAEYLRRFSPEELEQQFGEALKRNGPLPTNPGQKYWELYADIYRVLAQTAPEGLPHAFAEEFAKAYETARAELKEQDRRPAPPASGRRGT